MLYHLSLSFIDQFHFLNIFKYISFRSICCGFTAFLIVFFSMDNFIAWCKKMQSGGQPIRLDGPESHLLTKKGTPTMGGVMILFAMTLSVLLWCDLSNQFLWLSLFVTLSYGFLGFMDDYLKVKHKNSKGVRGKHKLVFQTIISIIAYYWLKNITPHHLFGTLAFPILKNALIDITPVYIIFITLVMVGASNAVNLTDGLDGLVIVPVVISALCFGVIAYLVGNVIFADYLKLHYIPKSGEVALLMAAIIGAGLGFLWFNAPPAKIFMGDSGSLSLGGALGISSVITKHEIVLSIVGGLFVIEAISVILQVYYFKFTGGKRLFLMAPLHHHFEKKGWSESSIVIRFWIISVIFGLIGMSTLKIR